MQINLMIQQTWYDSDPGIHRNFSVLHDRLVSIKLVQLLEPNYNLNIEKINNIEVFINISYFSLLKF